MSIKTIEFGNTLVVENFAYVENINGQKIYAQKCVLYKNAGIAMYTDGNLIAFMDAVKLKIVDWGNFWMVVATTRIESQFSISIYFKAISSPLYVQNCNLQVGDGVIRDDNGDGIVMNYYNELKMNASEVRGKFKWVIMEITDIGHGVQMATIKRDEEEVIVPVKMLKRIEKK